MVKVAIRGYCMIYKSCTDQPEPDNDKEEITGFNKDDGCSKNTNGFKQEPGEINNTCAVNR